MACWVVPSVAAEFWGVSVDHVLGEIDNGSIPFKTESGWIFVDVAPWSAPTPAHDYTALEDHPPTYVVIPSTTVATEARSDGIADSPDAGPVLTLSFTPAWEEAAELAAARADVPFAHEWAIDLDLAGASVPHDHSE